MGAKDSRLAKQAQIIAECAPAPADQERLRRAYELILRAAARAREPAEKRSLGECLDSKAKPDGSGKGGRDR